MILAFDTSCDDTSVSCFLDKTTYSNVISSQNEIHKKYGGIMPEVAARKHIENIAYLTKEAMLRMNASLKDIDDIAVTVGPGLLPSLLVGVSFAKGLAYANKVPISPVNHIEGHIFAPFIEYDICFPFVALVISGGHTHIFLVKSVGGYVLLGKTLDDAVGEAFDKVARLLDAGYPGGPVIDRLSKTGNPDRYNIPKGMESKNTLNFSFSGTKTFVKNLVNNASYLSISDKADIAASFQKAAVDILWKRAYEACLQTGIKRLAVSGGVSANSRLREEFAKNAEECGIELFMPKKELTTDNALMIAFAASLKHSPTFNYSSIEANPRLRIY